MSPLDVSRVLLIRKRIPKLRAPEWFLIHLVQRKGVASTNHFLNNAESLIFDQIERLAGLLHLHAGIPPPAKATGEQRINKKPQSQKPLRVIHHDASPSPIQKKHHGSHPSSPPEPLPPLPPSTDLRYPFTRRTFGSFLWPGQPDDCGSPGHVKVTSRALAAAAARTEAARQMPRQTGAPR